MSTRNPRDPKFTLRIERALRAMEAKAEAAHPLNYFATIYRSVVSKEELQAWCDEFNSGSARLPKGKVDAVKRELGIISDGKASAASSSPQASAPAVTRPAPAQASTSKPSAPVAASSVDDGAAPWEGRPRGPRAALLAAFRVDLENLAEGTWGEDTIRGKLRSFCAQWMGSVRPAPGKVQRFLAWIESRERTPAKPSAPSAENRSPTNTRPPGVKVSRDGRIPPPPVRAVGAGWAELQVITGNFSGIALRYTGTKVKHPGIAIAKFAAQEIKVGERARVTLRYHAERGRLAIVPAESAGLVFRRQRSGGIRVQCKTIGGLLGAHVREFNLAEDKLLADSLAEFVEIGGAK